MTSSKAETTPGTSQAPRGELISRREAIIRGAKLTGVVAVGSTIASLVPTEIANAQATTISGPSSEDQPPTELKSVPIASPERNLEQATLRELAEDSGNEIGVMISSFHIRQPELVGPQFLEIGAKNFNLLTCPDLNLYSRWRYPLRPGSDNYDFTLPDASVDFAERSNMKLDALHLIWGANEATPPWLKDGGYSKDDLLKIMEEHIKTVVGRYRGRVHRWSVVNEILGTPWQPGNSFWHERLGPDIDWVEKAFLWADEADPQSEKMLNDFGIEIPGTTNYLPNRVDFVYNTVQTLKERGVPIHGVGFQAHAYGKDFITPQQVERNAAAFAEQIRKFQNLGVDVHITEFDMRLNGVPGTQEERFEIQGRASGTLLKTALDAGVKSFCVFGLSDKYSGLEKMNDPKVGGPDADPLLFDDNLQPKPAYFAFKQALTDAVLAKAA